MVENQGDLQDSIHGILREREGIDRRDLQTCQLPRLRLLHPARNLNPVTYGNEATIKGAYEQCSKTIQEGRYNAEIPNSGGKYCDTISFAKGDNIKGPMHTNDAFVICLNPTLGRNPSDPIEVSSPAKGWYSTKEIPHSGSNCEGKPQLRRYLQDENSPVLIPPETNSQLALDSRTGVQVQRPGKDLPERYDDDRRQRKIMHGKSPVFRANSRQRRRLHQKHTAPVLIHPSKQPIRNLPNAGTSTYTEATRDS